MNSFSNQIRAPAPTRSVSSIGGKPGVDVFPFHYLAGVIRCASKPHAIKMFKAITQLTFHTRHYKILEQMPARIRHPNTYMPKTLLQSLKRTYSIQRGATPPDVASLLDIEEVFPFVYEHADCVDEPPDIMEYMDIDSEISEISETEEWLVRCVLHPEVDTDAAFRHKWSNYIIRQPEYCPIDSAERYYEDHVDQATRDGTPVASCKSLKKALNPYVSGEEFNTDAVHDILNEFMQLGATAAKLWEDIWRKYGAVRGQSLQVEGHVADVTEMIEEFYGERINNPEHFLPLHVRQQLANVNLGGEFLVLLNCVFPNALAPVGSTICEDEFAAAFKRWIVEAATISDVDPDGNVAAFVRHIDMVSGLTGSAWSSELLWRMTEIENYSSPSSEWEEYEEYSLVDVQLVPYGRRNRVEDFTEQIVYPPSEITCTVCCEEFGADVDESSCRQLECCKHAFHWECLDGWINAPHRQDIVRCPNCRDMICGARPRRRTVSWEETY
jgi:hypothetical protein